MCSTEELSKDLTGKTAIVTGGNSGIGRETAIQLFKQGATVVIGSYPSLEDGLAVADELKRSGMAQAQVDERFFAHSLDLGDFASIRRFAGHFLDTHAQCHILVNNAGIHSPTYTHTKHGHEMHMGVNHIGPFFLTELLMDILVKTGTPEDPSRILCTASSFSICLPISLLSVRSVGAHLWASLSQLTLPSYYQSLPPIMYDDFNWNARGATKYDPVVAYGQSKLATLLHALERNHRYEGKNVKAVSLHPGFVKTAIVSKHLGPMELRVLEKLVTPMISPWEGAQTTLHCCLTDDLQGGAFYARGGGHGWPHGVHIGWPCVPTYPSPATMNKAHAEKMWAHTEDMIAMAVKMEAEIDDAASEKKDDEERTESTMMGMGG